MVTQRYIFVFLFIIANTFFCYSETSSKPGRGATIRKVATIGVASIVTGLLISSVVMEHQIDEGEERIAELQIEQQKSTSAEDDIRIVEEWQRVYDKVKRLDKNRKFSIAITIPLSALLIPVQFLN